MRRRDDLTVHGTNLNPCRRWFSRLTGSTWDSTARQYANEGPSGVDRLGYSIYAEALAGLFNAEEQNDLPAAVGIYARWGSGKVGSHKPDTLEPVAPNGAPDA